MIPAGNYMFKVKNRNTRTRCEICSKLTIKINAGWKFYPQYKFLIDTSEKKMF